MVEQPAFDPQITPETRQAAVGTDNPVAGYEQHNGVIAVAEAHGPGRFGVVKAGGLLAVGHRLAVGNSTQNLPRPTLKRCAIQRKRHGERLPFSPEILP